MKSIAKITARLRLVVWIVLQVLAGRPIHRKPGRPKGSKNKPKVAPIAPNLGANSSHASMGHWSDTARSEQRKP